MVDWSRGDPAAVLPRTTAGRRGSRNDPNQNRVVAESVHWRGGDQVRPPAE